ncbi:MAG: hypothetical protein KBD66_02210 [Candidatus Doudnabacteria bacterium]|nr:hypothetical protein [Candidatus Doudnabacteria bacterium]
MQESLLKADIFFFVATIAVATLTLLLIIGMLYILSILKTIKQISKTAQLGTATIVEGIQEAKATVSKEGFVPDAIFGIFKKLRAQVKRKHK